MASLVETGQQWDAPNAWPPVQALLVEGLAAYGGAHGAARACCSTFVLAWGIAGHYRLDCALPSAAGTAFACRLNVDSVAD